MPILATNSVFWALVVTSRPPPHPILQVTDSKKDVLQGMGAGNRVFHAPPKKWPFFAQNWPQNAHFGHKQCSLGSGGQC